MSSIINLGIVLTIFSRRFCCIQYFYSYCYISYKLKLIAQNLSRPDLGRDRAIPALVLKAMQTERHIYEYLHVVTGPVISWLRNGRSKSALAMGTWRAFWPLMLTPSMASFLGLHVGLRSIQHPAREEIWCLL